MKRTKDMSKGRFAALIGSMCAFAALLRFVLRGYSYLAYALVFIAALLIAHRLFPLIIWRILLVLVCIGFAYFCFVEALVISQAKNDTPPGTKYVIVLGSAVYGEKPSGTMKNRVYGALKYLENNPESIAVVSGGKGSDELISEAQCMHDLLIESGISEERIIMEDRSTSTMENLRFSFSIIRERGDDPDNNVAIVSSSYHLFRAKQMAKSLNVHATGLCARFGYPFVMLNFFIREAFGVTHMWVFGY